MRVLVAGVGNIFLSDDGFGCAVIQRLSREPLPPNTTLIDFGIRSVHLAFELMNDYDALLLVDVVSRGQPPGTLSVIEPEFSPEIPLNLDPHGARPETILSLLQMMGFRPKQIRLIGCEPASLDEGLGLTPAVAAAVERAAELVQEQLSEWLGQWQKGGASCLVDS